MKAGLPPTDEKKIIKQKDDLITKYMMTRRCSYMRWVAEVLTSELTWWVKEFCAAHQAWFAKEVTVHSARIRGVGFWIGFCVCWKTTI